MAKLKMYQADRLRDVRELILRAERIFPDRVMYKEYVNSKKIESYTYGQVVYMVRALGTKLLKMGYKNKHIALLGENCTSWVVSYLAIICGIGVVVPLDKELPAADLAKLAVKADVEVLITTHSLLATAVETKELVPQLKDMILMNPMPDTEYNPEIYQLPDLIAQGRTLLDQFDTSYINQTIDPEVMTEILFTSGTTGANKGVMLSHKNIISVVYADMKFIEPDLMSMSVLPINHTYECSCHVLGGMYFGITICFNDSLRHVMRNFNVFKPGFTIMVPMFVESMYRNIWQEAKKNGLEKHIRYGIWASNLLRKIGIDKRRKFFAPVLEKFGGNLTQIVCGGAPLSSELVSFFDSIGIRLVNGYGITECAPLVAANLSNYVRVGSVGHVIPSCTVRIAESDNSGIGEIQVRGDNVMLGYYKDEEATKASFTQDGWFKTGDLGYLDKDNFLYLNGRQKNLIILPNGKNVYPEEIEDTLSQKIPYIKEVVVLALQNSNNQDGEICAICYLDPAFVEERGKEASYAQLKTDIRLVNSGMARYKQISQIKTVDEEFEKTSTKKIKRHNINLNKIIQQNTLK